ncbi:hypothetical protein A2625_06435 [candidate division WOR-1 bacterium RIFCSPHIGHO2_01_FULL_53_15]|uniref:Uncharacterized protein n=1 Tax=candidate division WOR-1 bacterium RIFCSPHIGHO2_01_FULL_53_15 TaxID=1802564 RepID=A0A1F4Q1I9_UNCSA|nr:MAG: hypothetical protein A2625_06435 [candidate division WOR-1 bacterium RIFCSPHIGHO2_01_FULL_53_15]OGC13782.1 MAG: hypothetical protein A3D23_01795 [candidate division WOR-1 bacterium RIFCSPHIGHO2_02_FULL_53_26]
MNLMIPASISKKTLGMLAAYSPEKKPMIAAKKKKQKIDKAARHRARETKTCRSRRYFSLFSSLHLSNCSNPRAARKVRQKDVRKRYLTG